MTFTLVLWAMANDCDRECFEIPDYDDCDEGIQATEIAPGDVEILVVLDERSLEPWTLTRNGEVLFEDAAFRLSDAIATDSATSGDCSERHAAAFVVEDPGLEAGEYTYTLTGTSAEHVATVPVGDGPEAGGGDDAGCGCANTHPAGVLLGLWMIGAGALLGRRPSVHPEPPTGRQRSDR